MAKNKNKKVEEVEVNESVFDQHFIACVVRKDVKEMVAVLLEAEGKTSQAKAWRDTSRVTKALIDRTLINGEEEPEVEEPAEEVPEVEEPETPSKEVADKEMNESANELEGLFEDVTKALNKGKKKKAKKALQALEDAGVSGSEFNKLKKQIKAL